MRAQVHQSWPDNLALSRIPGAYTDEPSTSQGLGRRGCFVTLGCFLRNGTMNTTGMRRPLRGRRVRYTRDPQRTGSGSETTTVKWRRRERDTLRSRPRVRRGEERVLHRVWFPRELELLSPPRPRLRLLLPRLPYHSFPRPFPPLFNSREKRQPRTRC